MALLHVLSLVGGLASVVQSVDLTTYVLPKVSLGATLSKLKSHSPRTQLPLWLCGISHSLRDKLDLAR